MAITSVLKWRSTKLRAAAAIGRRFASLHSARMPSRQAAASPGGSSRPVTPGCRVSGMPLASLHNTGTSQACASTEVRPKVSGAIEGKASSDSAL